MPKMQKFFIFFILIFNLSLIHSQNQRFTYEYSFKVDSLNRESVEKEIMYLDVTSTGSKFYSALLLTRDSLFSAELEKGKRSQSIEIDLRKIRRPKVNFKVSKRYPDLETIYHTSLNASNLALKELGKMDWTISSETKDIEGFKTQKAQTTFGGRRWTAWFTNEIQLQDGPYKFCGLPGLILNVGDDKGNHVFRLIGSQKMDIMPELMDAKTSEIFVTKEKFGQLWKEYKNDPAKNIKQMHSSSELSDTVIYDHNKNPLTKQELIRRKEQGAKETFKKVNNFIELDLYK